MSDSFYSPSWYRVAELKPHLRSHTQIHRHEYRGQVWYILQDHAAGKSHRFTPAAYRFIGLMDGVLTVQELWDAVSVHAGDDAPTQDDVIRLLGQLHAADALITNVAPDSQELFRRFKKHERMKIKQRIWTPLAVRFPLFDPERFLENTYPYVRFLFSWFGVVLWVSVVALGSILAAVHWNELTTNIVDHAFTPQNLLVLWFVYPVVKALHELGHGYAVKNAGGEVHEIGIMLLVLIPVPYVDASSAWGFRDKRQRMLVGAAGIAVELFLGAIALFVWLSVESGSAHVIAYNVMLISGVSTLLFNGNPLLRFDGYYVLSDAIEIPNLGNRSNKYLGYLIQRYLYGSRDVEVTADLPGERIWFVFYGIAAFIYRMFIMFAIILYIGGKFFTVGIVLAVWAITTQLLIPMGKNIKFLFSSPRLRNNRNRSVAVSAAILGTIIVLLFILPAPYWTIADGIIKPVEQSQVRVGTDGFIVRLLSAANSRVVSGQELIELHDPFLESRLAVLKARQKELKSQLTSAQVKDRVQTSVIREEIKATNADLDWTHERIDSLIIRSQRNGIFVIPNEQDLPNRFVRKGQLIAYVIEPADQMTLSVLVLHDEIALVDDYTKRINVMPLGWDVEPFEGEILRKVPGGTTQLPTAAFGTSGGGRIAVDPRQTDGRTTLERVFEIEISLPENFQTHFLGRRMTVRFDHGYKPLGLQLYRALRQLFLRKFSV